MNAPLTSICCPRLGGDTAIDDLDRQIILATQGGLPRVPRPYHVIGKQVGATVDEVMTRMQRMLDAGIVRRIGVVPNHYRLGYHANGMSVWNVPDERVRDLGRMIGDLDFVSHCYHRPRHLPEWPYNLFAMVHGRDRDEVEAKVAEIGKLLGEATTAPSLARGPRLDPIGDADRGHAVLYSTRILKKTGLRIGA